MDFPDICKDQTIMACFVVCSEFIGCSTWIPRPSSTPFEVVKLILNLQGILYLYVFVFWFLGFLRRPTCSRQCLGFRLLNQTQSPLRNRHFDPGQKRHDLPRVFWKFSEAPGDDLTKGPDPGGCTLMSIHRTEVSWFLNAYFYIYIYIYIYYIYIYTCIYIFIYI